MTSREPDCGQGGVCGVDPLGADLDVGVRVGTSGVADEHGVTLREIARTHCCRLHLCQRSTGHQNVRVFSQGCTPSDNQYFSSSAAKDHVPLLTMCQKCMAS